MSFLGLPTLPPTVTTVDSDNNSTCTVRWDKSDHADNYTVKWINLNTTKVDYDTVSADKDSYNITELDTNAEYRVTVTVMDVCGDPIESNDYPFNGEC